MVYFLKDSVNNNHKKDTSKIDLLMPLIILIRDMRVLVINRKLKHFD